MVNGEFLTPNFVFVIYDMIVKLWHGLEKSLGVPTVSGGQEGSIAQSESNC